MFFLSNLTFKSIFYEYMYAFGKLYKKEQLNTSLLTANILHFAMLLSLMNRIDLHIFTLAPLEYYW